MRQKWILRVILIVMSLPVTLHSQEQTKEPQPELPAVSATSQTNQELQDKTQLLNSALEEIVQLKDENQKLSQENQLNRSKLDIYTQTCELLREGRMFEAAEELKKIYALDPQDADAISNLGVLYCELKNYDEAAKMFEILISIRPQNEKAYANLGFVYSQKNEPAKGVEAYLKALALKPEFAVAHYNLGLCYVQLGEREKALDHFKTAANLFDPDSAWKSAAEEKVKKYSVLRGFR